MVERHLDINDYSYELPHELIAQFPAPERDQSRLLCYQNGRLEDNLFRNIDQYLPDRSLLVFNDTRVVRARIIFKRHTGATIEIFCLEPEQPVKELSRAFNQTGTSVWTCLVGNMKRWKDGKLIKKINQDGKEYLLTAELEAREEDGCFRVRFEWEPAAETFSKILELAGLVPLPPYIERASKEEDSARYQTVFAENEGSVAAPTAGLHFTTEVLDRLKLKGIPTSRVTLHVGLGTFRPVTTPDIADHLMHSEKIVVPLSTIEQLKKRDRTVVAVGTTSVRTIESLYWAGARIAAGRTDEAAIDQWEPYTREVQLPAEDALEALAGQLRHQGLDAYTGETRLMIIPGYRFRLTDILLTNFHQPQSTLLLLVAAFIGQEWKEAYRFAVEKRYRFLSYGDACLFFRTV